jgi:hypothetical protein
MCVRQEIGVIIQGGSRMRESRTYGSVRGARSNERPYRDLYYFELPVRRVTVSPESYERLFLEEEENDYST